MHVENILHQFLKTTIHKTRIKSIKSIIDAIIKCKELKLTKVGRNIDTKGQERSGIATLNKFLANKYYQKKNKEIYQSIIHGVIGRKRKAIIQVDWSGIPNSKRHTTGGEHCLLRATYIAEGRSITIYDEVHNKKYEGNNKVHKKFLSNLQSILPPNCCPIIVTDAGYKNPWFKAVVALGWDYVGRVRGLVQYDDGDGFKKTKELFHNASPTPKSLGAKILAKNNPILTNIYIYTHKIKGRKKITRSGKVARDIKSKKYSSGYREPWLLVSSMSGRDDASKVVKIYKSRMAIEENFRDVKSTEFGLSFNENKTINPERFIVWFMLSALTSLIAWIVGYTAEKLKLHYAFQANTIKNRRVLSFFYLGCQVIRKKIVFVIDIKTIQKEAWGGLVF